MAPRNTHSLIHSPQRCLHDATGRAEQHSASSALSQGGVKTALRQLLQVDTTLLEDLAQLNRRDHMVYIPRQTCMKGRVVVPSGWGWSFCAHDAFDLLGLNAWLKKLHTHTHTCRIKPLPVGLALLAHTGHDGHVANIGS